MAKLPDHLEVRIGRYGDILLVYCVPCSDYWCIPGYRMNQVLDSIEEFSKVHKDCTPGDNVLLRAQRADRARMEAKAKGVS